MRDKILKLRSEGKSYTEIKNILGCSKSTISFHCGEGQKEKNNNRTKKNRANKKKSNTIKEKILKLRREGKKYSEIMKELNVPKAVVCYYCGDNQRGKRGDRLRKCRNENSLIQKLERYKGRKVKSATRDFQRRNGGKLLKSAKNNFSYKDVINKFGIETKCYLSGEIINLIEDKNYSIDHINPASKGGGNSLENLGILHSVVNYMKWNLSVDEFINWCEKILKHNGYKVEKINKEA